MLIQKQVKTIQCVKVKQFHLKMFDELKPGEWLRKHRQMITLVNCWISDLNEPPSTLQRLHNGTNAPHVPLKVELPIPEDEPYKRIRDSDNM